MGAPPGGGQRPGRDDPPAGPFDERELHEFDAPAEVGAAFATQRRVAIAYFSVFLLVTFAVPMLTVSLDWWTQARVIGGMSPSFLFAGVGLYLFFLGLGLAAATLADTIERRMLGTGQQHLGDPDDEP